MVRGAKEIWKTPVPSRVPHFFWIVLHRRCWTAAHRKRHGVQDADDCALCSQSSETIDHLVVACVFSRDVWFQALQLQQLSPSQNDSFCEWWLQARKRIPKSPRRGFHTLVLLIGWMLWKERNARTFRGEAMTVPQLILLIKEEAMQWDQAGFKHLRSLLVPW